MKVLTSCLLGSLLFLANQVYAEQTINLAACRGLTVEDFHAVAKYALNKRRYQIEEDTGDTLTGAQKIYKVEIAMTSPEQIVIRWKPGFGYKKDNWLISLKKDVLWRLFSE